MVVAAEAADLRLVQVAAAEPARDVTSEFREVLVDQLLPGGLTIVDPGVDHYFDHPDRELRSLALLEVLLKRLGAATDFPDRTFPLAVDAAHASLRPQGGDRAPREDGQDR